LSWFNKGTKAADTLSAGNFFALLAGNLRRKCPGEGGFSISDISQHLRRALNSDDRECQTSLLESTTRSSERYNNARDDLTPDNSKPELSSADLKNHSPKGPPNTVYKKKVYSNLKSGG